MRPLPFSGGNEIQEEPSLLFPKRTAVTDPPPVFWETVSQGTAISSLWGGARYFNVLIQGENIRTAIDPLGWVDWRQAAHGWGLLATSRGHTPYSSVGVNPFIRTHKACSGRDGSYILGSRLE